MSFAEYMRRKYATQRETRKSMRVKWAWHPVPGEGTLLKDDKQCEPKVGG